MLDHSWRCYCGTLLFDFTVPWNVGDVHEDEYAEKAHFHEYHRVGNAAGSPDPCHSLLLYFGIQSILEYKRKKTRIRIHNAVCANSCFRT